MSVYKDNDKGTWYFKCRVNGNHTTRRGFHSKAQAIKAENDLKNSTICSKTYGFVANEYINSLDKNKNGSAYSSNHVYQKHIAPLFENKRIDKISISDVRKLQEGMLNKHYGSNKSYSNRTINQITSTFNSILNYAVRFEYIDKNPCSLFKPLKEIKLHNNLNFWTDKQFMIAINKEKDFMWYAFLSLSYLTGMRKGEMRALQWNDIDFDNEQITINRHIIDKVRKKSTQNNIAEGRKNGGSHIIAMDKNIKAILKRLLEYDTQYDGWNENTFLFGIFKPIGQYSANRHLNTLANKAELPMITIHGLRHSHVSYLISKGLSPYEIANRIGDSIEMVLNVYGHMFPNPQKNIVKHLNNDFNFVFHA